MNKKYLIGIDLDGTLLSDSYVDTVSNKDIKAVNEVIRAGHTVCIITGRPWGATRETYNLLKLDTIVSNFNGAHVHIPNNSEFMPKISNMHINNVAYVINDRKLKKYTKNVIVEGPGWVALEKRDKYIEQVLGFNKLPKNKVKTGVDFNRIPLQPTGILLVIDTNGINHAALLKYLHRKYSDLVEISSWETGSYVIFDMSNIGITKGSSLSLLMRYYDVPAKNTIVIGDGYNDLSMFEIAEIPVAMKNANDDIKSKASYITNRTNLNSGVAEFLEKFLANENRFIEKLKRNKK